ncbi:MAG: GntR family transcriptional regulator [Hyphomicrobiales bacterium]|nr:MAG: GntR family transcriptional regulator [Hyphomicrobiales bacterium]
MNIDAKPRQNLTQKVVAELRLKVEQEKLLPGDKLPTEQKLMDEFGVSRTVIREAISGLKADGLLASRQGSGFYVAAPSDVKKTIAFLSGNPKTIASVIEALELRASVEMGAVELAAQRCLPAQEANIYSVFNDFRRTVEAGEISEKQDFAFHVAIAEASNNPKFVEFLTLIGRNIIPRSQLRIEADMKLDGDVERLILEQHRVIMEAIFNKDSEAARLAMKMHLNDGAQRYRALARLAQNS